MDTKNSLTVMAPQSSGAGSEGRSRRGRKEQDQHYTRCREDGGRK